LSSISASLAIVRDHPVIGVGTGGFAKAYAGARGRDRTDADSNPHSEYLNIAIQLGVIGLAALLYCSTASGGLRLRSRRCLNASSRVAGNHLRDRLSLQLAINGSYRGLLFALGEAACCSPG